MKIGLPSPFSSSPPVGGQQVHLNRIIGHLVAQGHEIHCFAHETIANVSLHSADEPGIRSMVEAVDVLYVRQHRTQDTFYSEKQFYNAARGTPLVWEIHATPGEERRFLDESAYASSPINHMKRKMAALLKSENRNYKRRRMAEIDAEEQSLCARAHFIQGAVCVSEFLLRWANQLGIQQTTIVPNGSDPEHFHPGHRVPKRMVALKKEGPVVLCISNPRLPWQPTSLTVRVAKRWLESETAGHFVVLTPDPQNYPVERRERLHIWESVPFQDVPLYLAAADIGYCPLTPNEPAGFSGSPQKIFDFMASETPVLTTPIGQPGKILLENKEIVFSENREGPMLRALLDLSRNPQRRTQIGQRARNRIVNELNWERASRDIAAFLQTVCNCPSNRPA